MLTISDALQLPILKQATVVAGEKGLDNQIRRVHIVDMPDARYEWAKGGELLLTSGVGLFNAPERQKTIISELDEKGLAGLLISVGPYLEKTPDIMVTAANELALPIIELPQTVPFIEVTEALMQQILNRQYALQEEVGKIHRILTKLVLDGGTLQDVATELSLILERSVTIESASFEVLAAAQVGKVDAARTRSVETGRTAPNVASRLIERGIYQQLLETRRALRVPTMPDLDMNMERIVAPIIVSHQIIGYVWIIAGDHALTDLDEQAIEHAATIAALIMFKERAVRDVEMTLRGDFFADLLDVSDTAHARLYESAHQFKFDLAQSYQVLVAESLANAGATSALLPRRIENQLLGLYSALVVERESRVVIVLQSRRKLTGRSIAHELVDALSHPAETILIGVGRPAEALEDMSESYSQAIEALEVAQSLGRHEGVMHFDDLGILHWIRHLPQEVLYQNKYVELIHKLAEYDAQHQSDLTLTLETYLTMGSASSETAARLSVHRNTLAYRLQRIEELIGLDLHDVDCRLNLHIALISYRLKDDND